MIALRIARTSFFTLALLLGALAVVRLAQDVTSEGAGCGPGWTTEYDGPCDSALKARQVEVVTELLLGVAVATLTSWNLRLDADD